MGGTESKRSTRSDLLPNVEWSLKELMLWRERGIDEKCFEEKGLSKDGNQGAAAAATAVSDGNASASIMATKPASDIAATQSSSMMTDTSRAGDTAATPPGGADHPSSLSSSSSSSSGGSSSSTSSYDSSNMAAAADRADGEVIRDKYSFILRHIQKLVQASEENCMMGYKEYWLKTQSSKINTGQSQGPTMRAELDSKINNNATEMMKQLADFDNARMAVQWLQRHFDLLVRRRSLGREICDINMRIAQIQNIKPSDETLDELRHLRVRLQAAHAGVATAVRSAQQLRRESLAVGLQYLDTNHSGSIEPEDQPQLSAELFSRLDVRNRHKITPADLQSAVEKMEKNIEILSKNIAENEREVEQLCEEREKVLSGVGGEAETDKRRVRAEELHVEVQKKKDIMIQLRGDKAHEEAALRDTFAMFQNAFVESLFAKLGDGREDKHRYDSLSGDMEAIERNIKNLHIAADHGAKGLAASKLSASPLQINRKSSPLTFGRRKASSGVAESSSSSSIGSSSRSRASSNVAASSTTDKDRDTDTTASTSTTTSSSSTGSSSGDKFGASGSGMTAIECAQVEKDKDNMSNTGSSEQQQQLRHNIERDVTRDDDTGGSDDNMVKSTKNKASKMAQQGEEVVQQVQQQQQQRRQGDTDSSSRSLAI